MCVYPALLNNQRTGTLLDTLSSPKAERGGGQVEAIRRPDGDQAEEVETSSASAHVVEPLLNRRYTGGKGRGAERGTVCVVWLSHRQRGLPLR